MKISTKGRYGLRAMVDLAFHKDEKCISVKSIAERQNISEHYLEQIISPLKKAGFVKSIRGAQGGYLLNVIPKDITVGDILRVLEGSLSVVECVDSKETTACGHANCDMCVAKGVWEKLHSSINEVVDSISLEDLANDYIAVKENNQHSC